MSLLPLYRLLIMGFCLLAFAIATQANASTPAASAPIPQQRPIMPLPKKQGRSKETQNSYAESVGTSRGGNRKPPHRMARLKTGNTLAALKGKHHVAAHKGWQNGIASWYGADVGKVTASGEAYDMRLFTAAHRSLPLDSKCRVTNLNNGRSVTVTVTDRGPATKGRIIDLSRSAADSLGMRSAGLARVRIEPLSSALASGS